MGNIMDGFVLQMLLLTAALLSWNLISLVDLSAFLIMQFDGSKAEPKITCP